MSRTAIYLRQSVDLAEGIERQRQRCSALAAAKDWTVVDTFVDNETSASKVRGEKTEWARMLRDLKLGRFQIVVAVDLDRLLRTTRDLVQLIDLGAKVVTVDGEIDLSTADGEFRATMLAGIARFEGRRKSERQLRANEFRVAEGRPVPGGRRRFGFESDHLTLIKSEAAWIKWMHEALADGASLRSIARRLNEEHVPCVTKGMWNAARIQKILKNPAYRGFVIHHKQGWSSDLVPVVIEPGLADRVDAILADPSRKKTPGPERRALLGGLAKCGTCGAALTSAGTKYRGEMVLTYACSAVKDGRTNGVGHPSIRRAILDAEVENEVMKAFMVGAAEIGRLPSASTLAAIEQELATLHQKKADLLSLVGTVTIEEIKTPLKSITRQIDELSSQRQSIVASDAHAGILADMSRELLNGRLNVADMENHKATFPARWQALDLDMKRLLIDSLLDVIVFPGRGSERVTVRHRVVDEVNGWNKFLEVRSEHLSQGTEDMSGPNRATIGG